MGEAARRRNELSVEPKTVGEGMPQQKPTTCMVVPGTPVEQAGQDGVIYHVQPFHLGLANGQFLGLDTPAGFIPFTFMAVPIPVRRAVLLTPGAQMARG